MPSTRGGGESVEALAGRREGDARAASLEQFDRELLLQRSHQARHGRLAQAHVLGRPADALKARRRAERPELLESILFLPDERWVEGHGEDKCSRLLFADLIFCTDHYFIIKEFLR